MSLLKSLCLVLLAAALSECVNVTNTTTAAVVVPPLRWQAILFIVLLITFVVVLSTGILKVLPAMGLMAVVLFVTQEIRAADLFVGFSNNGNVAIALLFIVVNPIAQLPLIQRLVAWMMNGATEGQRWPLFKVCLVSMVISSFLENTPHVAIFTSMITRYCSERGIPSSPYLMPMSFAVILGNYAVFGSGSNLVIAGLLESNHAGEFPTFELAKSGVLSLPFVLAYLVFAPQYLIAQDKGTTTKRASKSSYVLKCRVAATSSLIDKDYKTLHTAFPGGDESEVTVRRVLRGDQKIEAADAGSVAAGDVIAFTGPPTQLVLTSDILGFTILSANDAEVQMHPHEAFQLVESDQHPPPDTPVGAFFEVVLSGSFVGLGQTVESRVFQQHYRLSIVSIRRGTDGQDLGITAMPSHLLNPADSLVCYGPRGFSGNYLGRPDFLLISPIGTQLNDFHPLVYRFPRWVPWGKVVRQGNESFKAFVMPAWFRYFTLVLFGGIVVLSSLEITALSALCFVVVVLYVILGITDSHTAVHLVHYEVYVVIAFSFPLGAALQSSGLSATIGASIASAGITGFPLLLLISLVSLLLANVITNIASAQVMVPIILSIYRRLPMENQLAAIVTSAQVIVCAICTPYSIPPNMLIYGPGGYTPKDYLKLGVPLSLLFTLLVPLWSAVVYGVFSN